MKKSAFYRALLKTVMSPLVGRTTAPRKAPNPRQAINRTISNSMNGKLKDVKLWPMV